MMSYITVTTVTHVTVIVTQSHNTWKDKKDSGIIISYNILTIY